jgi:MYXO-CTERM domain-containing protein
VSGAGGTGALKFDSSSSQMARMYSSSEFGIQDVGGGGLVTRFQTSAPAPEPDAWALMIAGFGLTGAAFRRRRADPSPLRG